MQPHQMRINVPLPPLTLFLLRQMRPQKIERRKTPPLTEPKYDRTEGSEDVTNLLVPTLAYDDTSVTLVWNKPEKYDTVADYAIYQDGELIGTARENFAEHADWASTYMDAFYEYYEKKNIEMVNVDIHSFTQIT